MSQNVTNNWFQKLGTDSNFLDRSTGTRSVSTTGSTFQSFLSQQIKKSSTVSASLKAEANVPSARESKTLKRMDTTASKLAMKSPDKAISNGVRDRVEGSGDKDNRVQKVESSSEKIKGSNRSNLEEQEALKSTEPTQEVTKTTELSEIAPELLQMLQTLPEEVIVQLPEELQGLLAELSEKLQGFSTLVDGKGEGNHGAKIDTTLKIDVSSQSSEQPLVKTELVETLKQVIGQLKASETVNPDQAKSFEDVLEQLKSQVVQNEVVKPMAKAEGSQEGKGNPINTENTSAAMVTNNTNTGNGNDESKPDLNGNTANQNVIVDNKTSKNTKNEVQMDGKSDFETSVHNFSAKAEVSSIAFGKQEMAAQTTKNALHTNIMDQIMNSPKLQIKQTEQGATMTLKLNPEVLGNVEIKMEIVKGVLQAEINVENMIVKGAIESSLADLKNALSDKGYQVDTLNVSVGQEGRQSQQQQPQERQSNDRTVPFTPEELEAINSSYDFDTVVNDTRIDYLG